MKNTNNFYEVWQLLNEVIYFYDEDNSNEHKSIYKPLYEAPNGPGSDTGKKATLGYYINEYIRQMGYVLPQPQENQECQEYESYQEYQQYKKHQENQDQLILDHAPQNNLAPIPIGPDHDPCFEKLDQMVKDFDMQQFTPEPIDAETFYTIIEPEPLDQEENKNVIKRPIKQGHRKKIFNDGQIKDIKYRYWHGESITSIAKLYRCSRKTIYNYLELLKK